MIKRLKSERRQYPRIATELPVNIAADGYTFSTNTQNLSCVGAYCRLTKYIPPFTKVSVKMVLPIANKNGIADNNIECKGVIVRTEDDKTEGFNIAIFFNEIKDNERQKISKYINQFFPK
ncbi:MAG: PilZ domain-containing protein [Candidatus Omnitrophota bacterium]